VVDDQADKDIRDVLDDLYPSVETPIPVAEPIGEVIPTSHIPSIVEEAKESTPPSTLEKEPQQPPMSASPRPKRFKSWAQRGRRSSLGDSTTSQEDPAFTELLAHIREARGLNPPPLQTVHPEATDTSSSTPLDTSSSPNTGDTLSTPGIPESSSEERRREEQDKKEQAEFEAQEDKKEQDNDPDFNPDN
jgi:hypothetical protein